MLSPELPAANSRESLPPVIHGIPFDARCCISRDHLVKPELVTDLHHNISSRNRLRSEPADGRLASFVSFLGSDRPPAPNFDFASPIPLAATPIFLTGATSRPVFQMRILIPSDPDPRSRSYGPSPARSSATNATYGAFARFVAQLMRQCEDFFRFAGVIAIIDLWLASQCTLRHSAKLASIVTFLGFTSLVASQFPVSSARFFRRNGHFFRAHPRPSSFIMHRSKPGIQGPAAHERGDSPAHRNDIHPVCGAFRGFTVYSMGELQGVFSNSGSNE